MTRTFVDYLRELELLDTFRQLGRIPSETIAVTGERAPAVAAADPRASSIAPSASVTKPVALAAISVDPARAARIAAMDWPALMAEADACTACGLCKLRDKVVFGTGSQSAAWLLVGEGPGEEENRQGEPFVGPAGKLLDAMLAAVNLQRGRDVYIANVVKCRPPGNRNPEAAEAAACAPFLDRQIDLIQPKMIVALGKIAVMRLTGSDASMAAMRGKLHRYRGIPVIATYHPAYLLRSLTEKLKGWEDLLFARQEEAKQVAAEVK